VSVEGVFELGMLPTASNNSEGTASAAFTFGLASAGRRVVPLGLLHLDVGDAEHDEIADIADWCGLVSIWSIWLTVWARGRRRLVVLQVLMSRLSGR